ncbi:MAG: site-specific DNA-methyltransferase [Opitutales bacterium]|nr:site-specific DNA-methyltransferase [Opitutales bacterium]
MAKKTGKAKKTIESITHADKRVGIPTAEEESFVGKQDLEPKKLLYPRNADLDPQLVWKGKDAQDSNPLEVKAMPIFIQEKIHPRNLIKDIENISQEKEIDPQMNFFADFNGVPKGVEKTDFYHYEKNWTNRMILGDSLQVMASLAEKEGLRGQVQCVYMDPPYGIKFNSNFQWSTTTTDVKDGKAENITREPEMVKAFRDTWRYGIHSYLSYLRDRLTIVRDLLTESGSVFVQIGDENVHRVRSIMDEVFGEDNYISQIQFVTTSGRQDDTLDKIGNYVIWFAKNKEHIKYNQLFLDKITINEEVASDLQSQGSTASGGFEINVYGKKYIPFDGNHWKTTKEGICRLLRADRIKAMRKVIRYRRFSKDFPVITLNDVWTDTGGGAGQEKIYVVQTGIRVIMRCILMTTDPGDIVLDPTCGGGTTAYVAEQWGRRWITIDTSRVALALARARIMGAKYPYYLLADSREGQIKEAELQHKVPSDAPTYGNVRHGFVYERVPHITLKSIANNAEIDIIWDNYAAKMDALRKKIGNFEEWQMPRVGTPEAEKLSKADLEEWWNLRIARQKEIDASIAAKAEFEYLYDKPYVDNSKVRVAGPFTVESLNPVRMLGVGADNELLDTSKEDTEADFINVQDFTTMILETLKIAGVQHSDKSDKIDFESLESVPGEYICAEGKYTRGDKQIRAGIFIGPEFGTVCRQDIVRAAREAVDRGYDEVITCAFNYDALSADLEKLGVIPIIKARMNADLHMAGELKNTGSGNLFVVFGEPDIEILHENDKLRVKINGIDIFKPQSGKVESSGTEGIACWFIDTNYDEESFFVRHAYFLGQKDPYESLKKTLKAEIDKDAWESIHSNISRPFDYPKTNRIAVKVINHLGDEVLKVYGESDLK